MTDLRTYFPPVSEPERYWRHIKEIAESALIAQDTCKDETHRMRAEWQHACDIEYSLKQLKSIISDEGPREE